MFSYKLASMNLIISMFVLEMEAIEAEMNSDSAKELDKRKL